MSYIRTFIHFYFFSHHGNQGDNGSSALSLANESQFLLITRTSTTELLMGVKPPLESEVSTVECPLVEVCQNILSSPRCFQ